MPADDEVWTLPRMSPVPGASVLQTDPPLIPDTARERLSSRHAHLPDALAQAPARICVTPGPRHVIDSENAECEKAIAGYLLQPVTFVNFVEVMAAKDYRTPVEFP